MVKETVIYQIRNIINGKVYIGSTVDYVSRQKRHIRRLNRGNHHSIILQRSWNKYGSDNFIFEVLEIIDTKEIILEREQHYLDLYESYNPKNGFNICKVAGTSIGFRHTKETKIKMSKSHTGVKKGPCLDETKKKISETKLNLDLSEATIKREKTLLSKDKDIFKKIGKKSSETQKKNGLNKGSNNPNYDNRNLLIYNSDDEIVFVISNEEFENLCIDNNLPNRALIKSRISNGEYRLYLKRLPKNKNFEKYRGWYCKYEN
jgi:group I intron endonuclease